MRKTEKQALIFLKLTFRKLNHTVPTSTPNLHTMNKGNSPLIQLMLPMAGCSVWYESCMINHGF